MLARNKGGATVTKLYEYSSIGEQKVDRERCVIPGVKILGRTSKNGREYSDKALREAAAKYEGVDVNVNHPDRSKPHAERKIEDAMGWLESVEIRPDGVYGDLHYLKEHPSSSLVAEVAERRSTRLGLSHNAQGTVSKAGNKNVVESIERVLSVDLVQNPATNEGLFESELRTIREVLNDHAPELLASLLEDGALLPPEAMDEPMPPMAGEDQQDPMESVKQAMSLVLKAMLDMPGDLKSLCSQGIDFFQKVIAGQPDPAAVDPNAPSDPNAQQKLDANGNPIPPDPNADPASPDASSDASKTAAADPTAAQDPSAETDPANPFQKRKKAMAEATSLSTRERQELETLREQVKQLSEQLEHKNLREQCEVLLRKNHREVSDAVVTALANMPTEEARLQLVEELPSIKPAEDTRPRKPNFMSPPIARNDSAYPGSVKDLVEACR